MREVVSAYGRLESINLYGQTLDPSQLSPFTSRGCALHATPPSKHSSCERCHKKEVADQSIIADLLLFAWHHRPPATVVLISDDSDFSKTLTRLRDLGYRVVLIHQHDHTRAALRLSADIVLHWRRDVLQHAPRGVQSDAQLQPQLEDARQPPPLELVRLPLSNAEVEVVVKEEQSEPRVKTEPPPHAMRPYSDFIEVLRRLTRERRTHRHLRSLVGIVLRESFDSPPLGLKFATYASSAEVDGVVELGGCTGDAWIQLSPQYREGAGVDNG